MGVTTPQQNDCLGQNLVKKHCVFEGRIDEAYMFYTYLTYLRHSHGVTLAWLSGRRTVGPSGRQVVGSSGRRVVGSSSRQVVGLLGCRVPTYPMLPPCKERVMFQRTERPPCRQLSVPPGIELGN